MNDPPPNHCGKQVAKYMAEYWASAWERKEGEAAEAAAALHRAEVRQGAWPAG